MMYAESFDQLKRKMLKQEPAVLLNKLTTASINTPEFELYSGLFMLPENTTIHMQVEPDGKTYTFYTIYTDPHTIELELNKRPNYRQEHTANDVAFV